MLTDFICLVFMLKNKTFFLKYLLLNFEYFTEIFIP